MYIPTRKKKKNAKKTPSPPSLANAFSETQLVFPISNTFSDPHTLLSVFSSETKG